MTTQPATPIKKPTLVTFLGNLGSSPAELLVAGARRAATLDTIEAALATGAYERAILATDDPAALPPIPHLELDLDAGLDPTRDALTGRLYEGGFHFGKRLAALLERHGLKSVVYLGGGSLPLLDGASFGNVAQRLAADAAITNNAFSSDLIAFPVNDSVLDTIRRTDRDNSLARALEESAGLALEEMPRTVATQMDLDAPSDLAVLTVTGEGGLRLRSYLRSLDLDLSQYERVLPLFTSRDAQVVVAGRVGSHAWPYLERETACRVRLFAEERGLEAEGRAEDRTARSLLGFFIEAASIDRLFEILPELGDAAFIDTRVLLAHFGIGASREERFLSDLGRWSGIRDPFLRDFTRGAVEGSIPVLLGGHSLMSGGLMALNENAWRGLEDSAR